MARQQQEILKQQQKMEQQQIQMQKELQQIAKQTTFTFTGKPFKYTSKFAPLQPKTPRAAAAQVQQEFPAK